MSGSGSHKGSLRKTVDEYKGSEETITNKRGDRKINGFTSPVSFAITKSSPWGVLGILAGPAYSSDGAVKFRFPASYTAAQ